MNEKALIAMSGGVDSSVAAYLMIKAGYECQGATMKLYSPGDEYASEQSCLTSSDIEDARNIALRLGMPYDVYNFSDRFKEEVMDKFVYCYEHGITPNPCVDCNRYLKFEYLFDKAHELGCDFVVTGHYAAIEYDEKSGRYLLKKSDNLAKDQSYFLYSLSQEQLSKAKFPLGQMDKGLVRQIAEEQNFINANKSDSQDICFVTNGKYSDFIEKYTGKTYEAGDFVDIDGNVLGRHSGIIRYTIGQRKGLGVSFSEPLYVVKVDVEKNQVVLGKNEDLFSRELIADDFNWISIEDIDAPLRVKARVRYRHTEQWANVEKLSDGRIRIVFDEPQRAITKGQSVVLYDEDVVVGGGTIVDVAESK